MRIGKQTFLSALPVGLGIVLMAGCHGPVEHPSSTGPLVSVATGTLVTFGTDIPICGTESMVMTITSASLIPSGGAGSGAGTAVPIITSTAPATVDFARLTDFTTILATAPVAPGTYNQLQMTLTNPQLTLLNTATSPPSAQSLTAIFPNNSTTDTITVNISPALKITSNITTGITMDFDLRDSLQVDAYGQVTGTIDPEFILTPVTASGTTVGEADSLYGIIQSVALPVPTGFTGAFGLTLHDGTGQTLTILADNKTVFEGDGVTSFSGLTAGTFVEVDAIVSTNGQIVAQIVDSEEQASVASQKSAFLGTVISITRDGLGNATAFTLLVNDEVPDLSGTIPLYSGLNVTLSGSTHYFTNWGPWNLQSFIFGPTALGLAQKVAVFGVLVPGSPPALTANQVFLRPRGVLGNFNLLEVAGSGAFTMTPCGALFGGKTVTVLTYTNTVFNGISGLADLTTSPTIDSYGVLFYEQSSGTEINGTATWTPPTWVLQAKGVHQLPN
jgi:hypothetical protein